MSSGPSKLEVILTGEAHAISALGACFTIRALEVERLAPNQWSETFYDAGPQAEAYNGLSAGFVLSVSAQGAARTQKGAQRKQIVRFTQRPPVAFTHGNAAQNTSKNQPAGRLQADAPIESDVIATPLPPGENPYAPTGDAICDGFFSFLKEGLSPYLRLNAKREGRLLSRGGAVIELSTDTMSAMALNGPFAGAARHIGEARLSLLGGGEAEFFKIVRLLLNEGAGAVRLGLGAAMAPDRIFADEAALAHTLSPANRIVIEEGADAASVLSAGLSFCAWRMLSLVDLAAEHHIAEAGRQMRIALRRFRSIERLFRSSIKDGGRMRALSEQARGFAHMIGAARDWDVFLSETLPELERGGGLSDARAIVGFARIRAQGERLRAKAWARAGAAISSEAFAIFALDLLEQARLAPWRDGARKRLFAPAPEFAARALDKRLEEAASLAHDLAEKPPEAGHVLRLALKKLRYNAQLFRDFYPRTGRKPYLQAMSELQDAFGVLNDAVVAQSLADRAAFGQGADAARAAGFISGYHAAQAKAASVSIAQKWDDFAVLDPFWR